MEGRERAACEARLQALRNVQTLLDAASLQFQQYLATAPSVNLQPPTTSEEPQPSSSNETAGPSNVAPRDAAHAGEAQAVE
jgi:hypothetical protein